MMMSFGLWMAPALVSAIVFIWLAVAAVRATMSTNGLADLMLRLQVATFILVAVWALYGGYWLGAVLVGAVL